MRSPYLNTAHPHWFTVDIWSFSNQSTAQYTRIPTVQNSNKWQGTWKQLWVFVVLRLFFAVSVVSVLVSLTSFEILDTKFKWFSFDKLDFWLCRWQKKGACIIDKDGSGCLTDRLVKSVYFFPIMLKSTRWDSLAMPASNKQLPIAPLTL